MPPINAAILCRVSSEGQRDNTSLPEQRRLLTELCDRHGWAYEVFEEVESGGAGLANRPVLAGILGRVAAGEFQRLVVLVPDRLTRAGAGELGTISATLAKVGGRLVTQSGEFDPANLDHDLMLDFHAVLAKNERLRIRERMIRGKEVVAKKGGFVGHPIPYGWRRLYHPDGSSYVEHDPQQAAAVRRMFDLYSQGAIGYVVIADQLRGEGYAWHDGDDLHWQHVYRIIRNKLYAGIQIRRRDYTAKDHRSNLPTYEEPSTVFTPIVSVDLWERCRVIRESRKAPGRRSAARDWPLSGVLRCLSCGASMISHQAHDTAPDGAKRYYHYYRCSRKIKRLGTCKQPQTVRADIAHRAVWRRLPKILEWAESAAWADDAPEASVELLRLQARLADLEREERELFRSKSEMDARQWARLNQALLDERDDVERAIDSIRRQQARPHLDLLSLREILTDETLLDDQEDLRRLFATVLTECVLEPSGVKIRHGEKVGWKVDTMRLKWARLTDGRLWSRLPLS